MGHPLRVLHVVVNMNRGGAETLIMNLYRNIDRSKVQFDFLTCKEGVFDSEIESMGGKIYRIPYITSVGHVKYQQALDQFFKTNRHYTIVHSHMDKMSGFVLRAAKKADIPIRIAHSHNTRSEGGWLSRVYKWYAGQQINANASHFFACSKRASNWLYGKNSDRALILKNGVETNRFRFSITERENMRKELGIAENSIVLGHVGRLFHQKNQLFLLDMFAKVTEKLPHAFLVLAGDGPLQDQLNKKIKELNLECKVKLLGVRDDIPRLLQAFDLFVFPSLHEGLPVTLIEAQAAGLPCLISDAITNEVDMGMGLVTRLSLTDPDRWIENMIEQTQNSYSREIAPESLISKGYDIRKTAERTQHTYLTFGAKVI